MSELVETIEKMDDLAVLLQIKEHMMGDYSVQAVDGRALWKALEVKRDFTNWMKDKIAACELELNQDYLISLLAKKGEPGKGAMVEHQYTLSIDSAKHICMTVRGEHGKRVRKYFLANEKKVQEVVQAGPVLTQEQIEISNFNFKVASYDSLAKSLGYSQGEVRNEALKLGFAIEKKTGFKVIPSFLENDSIAINPDTSLTKFEGTHAALVGQGTNCTNVTSIVEMFPKKQITSKEINDILIELGYQVRTVVGQYTLTQKGRKYGNTTLVTKGITQGNQKVTGWDLTFKDFKKELFDSIERRIKYNEARAQMNQYKSKK